MRRFFTLVLTLLICLVSCQKAPVLTLSSTSNVELSADGGSAIITFTANRDWSATSSDSWVTVSPSYGTASDGLVTITVSCSANTTYDDRNATITITAEDLTQSVTVKQPAKQGLIVPTPDYEIKALGGTIEVEVQSNVQYSVSIDADWISRLDTKGLTTDKLSFKVEENKTRDSRNASITISGGGMTQVVAVRQEKEYCLTFDIVTGGEILWKCSNSAIAKEIQYSINGGEWVSITSAVNGESVPVRAGDAVRIKAYNTAYYELVYGYSNFFSVSKGATFNARGSIMSLIYGDECKDKTELTEDGVFACLFSECEGMLVAPELPATTLTTFCYSDMFRGCTSLEKAPELPALALANGCYSAMFWGCTSLEISPELPATVLHEMCYHGMFLGCISLETAPALPAISLADQCYNSMFRSCSSLKEVPELPATSLAARCYESMFEGCDSLTEAPELPATTLADYCYSNMFYRCTSLRRAPELPATTIMPYCYHYMFYGCSKLEAASALPATTLAIECYFGMFEGCTSLKVAPELPATVLGQACYSNMFANCTSLEKAPELSATAMVRWCYGGMFTNCTSLEKAPDLPATTLAEGCYAGLFSGCTKINYVKCLALDNDVYYYYDYDGKEFHPYKVLSMEGWLENVSQSGTFIKHPRKEDWEIGPSGIPEGWTVQDAEL